MHLVPISPVPPSCFFSLGVQKGKLWIDGNEHYVKQSIRNRYHIMTANGVLPLSIFVKGQGGVHIPTAEIEIDYHKPWLRTHLRALESAYRSAPYFEHFWDEVKSVFETPYPNLMAFAQASIPKWQQLLKTPFEIEWCQKYIEEQIDTDWRILAKSPKAFPDQFHPRPYIQVFADRYSFEANLSVLDLIFNLGPEAISHLRA